DHRGRERDEHGPQQEIEVQHEDESVDASGRLEDPMVIEPHDAEHEEAEHVAEIVRPLLPQTMGECFAFRQGGRAYLDHEQGDGTGEYAIRNRLEPVLREHSPVCACSGARAGDASLVTVVAHEWHTKTNLATTA